jgi:O-antigen/teichoic acid export membrane protein
VSGYLRRLATTGAAYTAASIISKLIAVALLPLYTRHLTTDDYGAAEVLFAGVVTASIVVRLGLIEAVLRFYYQEDEDPKRIVGATFSGLFWFATIGALIALPFAEPLAEALLDPEKPAELHTYTELVRIAIGGLWVATLFEYLLTLFRLDERARAYFVTTIANVLGTIGLTIVLVVGAGDGARGLLLGSYLTGAVFVLAMIFEQRRRLTLLVELPLLRRLLRFGLPTMPAEVSLYLLNFADRLIITRSLGLAEAGGEVRPGGQRPRPRLPARLAAARLLDP